MLQFPDTALPKHRQFLTQAIPVLAADPRLLGVAASGSYSENNLDTYSDLDLVIVIAPEHFTEVMSERPQIAANLGPLLGCFTGEHVGEPRLLICLYGPDLLHVDLKFVALPDATQRVDQPVVLWQRQQLLSDIFASGTGHYPKPDPQWLEDRIWIWCHYGADKILRGELLEADAFLAFIRSTVLAPLAQLRAGLECKGLRRLEQQLPQLASELRHTTGALTPLMLFSALEKTISLYLQLRPDVQKNIALQQAVLDYINAKSGFWSTTS